MSVTLDLHGKRVLVTGGNRGIGRAIVDAFAAAGADVAVFARNTESVKEAANAAAAKGVRALPLVGDVAKLEDVERAWEEIQKGFGGLDVLVNNAGVTRDNLVLRMKPEEWQAVLDVNLTGAFHWCRAVLKSMIRQRSGRIVNVASIVGITGNAGQANYAASKAGLIGFSKSLAQEVASRNVTVNVIAPGFIDTEMTAALGDQAREAYRAKIPLGRLGTGADIAAVALFLASPLSDYITGQVVCADGGLTM